MISSADRPILAIDGGSPLLSVAVRTTTDAVAVRQVAASRSSTLLMGLLDDCLRASGLRPADLGSVVALSGPGSFTGLRVGLSIALGLQQALEIPAAALPTFTALAAAAPDGPVSLVVRARKGEWYVRSRREASGEWTDAARRTDAWLFEVREGGVVGLAAPGDAQLLRERLGDRWIDPGPLAPMAIERLAEADDRPGALTRPSYLEPPPVHGGRPGAPT